MIVTQYHAVEALYSKGPLKIYPSVKRPSILPPSYYTGVLESDQLSKFPPGSKMPFTTSPHRDILYRFSKSRHLSDATELSSTDGSSLTALSPEDSDQSNVSPEDQCCDAPTEHVIHLSSIEHCMPRAYIRICMSYRVLTTSQLPDALQKLDNFIRRTVNAKPYLAGYVCPAEGAAANAGPSEIRFTNEDFLNYPSIGIRELRGDNGQLLKYDELDRQGLPPSQLLPDQVAILPADVNDERKAPVFRVQANVVEGGLIVSIYLHHCMSDGMGISLLITGKLLEDDFAFKRDLHSDNYQTPCIGDRLSAFANQQSIMRQKLSWSFPNQINTRRIKARRHGGPLPLTNPPGRGCVLSVPYYKIAETRARLNKCIGSTVLTRLDTLQALLWRCMTRARMPSLAHLPHVHTSALLTPVNIRDRLQEPLPEHYFGAAVDSAKSELPIADLVSNDDLNFAKVATTIHEAIRQVDEPYIRQAIALARSSDPSIDVRDLQASNMDRVTGADMYITSWERLGLYDSELEMGLGKPDWVRKPWSRDPGSCIILPRNEAKPQFEVVVQMTVADMDRLLQDVEFMSYVTTIID